MPTPNPKTVLIGEIAQLAGAASVVAGLILSLHHWPVALTLIGGLSAFFVGKKLRAS